MNLYEYTKKPEPYAKGPSIWTDPHIANQMLLAHLSDENGAASYASGHREAICQCLWDRLHLTPGMELMDLGCGPGLYAQWFAQRGLDVLGVDISANSLEYARTQAVNANLPIRYKLGDYREPLPAINLDAAVMISEDYGVLSPSERTLLLDHVYAALKLGGAFAMDVTAAAALYDIREGGTWHASPAGFWRPHPHVVLEKNYLYPEHSAWCTCYVVIDEQITTYYVSQTAFTPERIEDELMRAGFRDVLILGDLAGSKFDLQAKQFGIIARK